MRSEGEKLFKYRSLLICFLCDRLFWIPVTVAVVFDDYTILHSTDHPDCAVDLFSLQHLAADWLSEFLTEIRDFAQEFHSEFSLWILAHFVAPGDIFLRRIVRQEFSPLIACVLAYLCSFCQDVIFLRTISTRSLRVLIVRAIIEP